MSRFHLLGCALAVLLFAAGCPSDDDGGGDACTPGTESCACGDGCGDGLTCFNDVCVPEEANNGENNGQNNGENNGQNNGENNGANNGMGFDGVALDVNSADARSCEGVVLDAEKLVTSVTFSDDVKGHERRRGDRLAVAFFAAADGAIPTGAVSFDLATADADVAGLTLSNVRCFDAEGKVLDGASFAVADAR